MDWADIDVMALMTQPDIREHYAKAWAEERTRSDAGAPSVHGSGAEDRVVQPIYLQLLRDLRIPVGEGVGDTLDVGCGAGRWVRFLQEQVKPRTIVGIDITEQSADLLRSRHASTETTAIDFRAADITDPGLELGGTQFDLINIANVLFHIPEHDLFVQALTNLRRHIAPSGCVMTTEYLPRTEMRTPWMLVRSRYTFEKLITQAGFRIAAIRAFTIFNNDPMGIDGPDDGARLLFNTVRQQFSTIEASLTDAQSLAFLTELRANVDRAVLAFCNERLADIDLPSQKLVALVPA